MLGIRVRTALIGVAIPFVALDAISLIDPDRFYEDALRPSLAAAPPRSPFDREEAPMSFGYHDGSRRLQDRFDTRRLAARLDERFLQRGVIDASDRAFIERMDMFFLATADEHGRPQCSYKGG